MLNGATFEPFIEIKYATRLVLDQEIPSVLKAHGDSLINVMVEQYRYELTQKLGKELAKHNIRI